MHGPRLEWVDRVAAALYAGYDQAPRRPDHGARANRAEPTGEGDWVEELFGTSAGQAPRDHSNAAGDISRNFVAPSEGDNGVRFHRGLVGQRVALGFGRYKGPAMTCLERIQHDWPYWAIAAAAIAIPRIFHWI